MPEAIIKQDIRKYDEEQLNAVFLELGEKKFRAKQVTEWLWKKSAGSFDEMSNLSVALRDKLKETFVINQAKIKNEQKSADGTIKSSILLFDGNIVEAVLIPTDSRMTACISSQVGCSLSCKFCATGYMDRKRNLEAGEIYDQVVLVNKQAQEHFGMPLTNIVYMGMGEPLLNFKNVMRSTELICGENGLNMSWKRITVSTAGIAKMIEKLGDEKVKFNLALSLHAANDVKRADIMPINESNTLDVLKLALQHYFKQTGNKVTYEYIVFKDFNDNLTDAEELYQFSKHTPCKINIIEYNPIVEANYQNTDKDKLDHFAAYLESKGLNVNIRRSRGKDIDAACGQLAGKEK